MCWTLKIYAYWLISTLKFYIELEKSCIIKDYLIYQYLRICMRLLLYFLRRFTKFSPLIVGRDL